MYKIERHLLNAAGGFFVEYGACTACDAPRTEAPGLIDYDTNGHCYFKRQPQTPDEIVQAVSAVHVSCLEAVLYDGVDLDILAQLKQMPCRSIPEPQQTAWNRLEDKLLRSLRRVLIR